MAPVTLTDDEPIRSAYGYIVMCTNLHHNISETDLSNRIIDTIPLQQPPHIVLPLNHRTGIPAGYALIAVNDKDEAMRMKTVLHGSLLFGQRIEADFAFRAGPGTSDAN